MIWAGIQIHEQSGSVAAAGNTPLSTVPLTLKNDQVEIPTPVPLPLTTSVAHINEILYPIRPTEGEHIGNLTIPAIDQIIPIFHGTDEDELKRGIGHFARSVMPGENDNSVLSGHRDTVFRKLGKLKIKDQLIVQTSAGIFTYEINKFQIVDKDDTTIIVPTDHAVLTVTTCYPFEYIGDAPNRYILTADLINSERN
ncbi:class D sortase [Paenibacillus sp. S3N08]|uniref:Class D sortase n=2 Tax=Paenibacillus agricola TaxID=2716264 RepID=A0ABX0J1G4_9BACL|nr:class D sortase [Paenibacillus agricola]